MYALIEVIAADCFDLPLTLTEMTTSFAVTFHIGCWFDIDVLYHVKRIL